MGIFSRELRTLDQNTVRYMIDQMQEDIDRLEELFPGQGLKSRYLRVYGNRYECRRGADRL